MTIGEKIAHLRIAAHLSQEALAEKLDVSRQSVSKWEMNQATPQLEKLPAICRLFSVTADDLIREDVDLVGDVPGQKSPINDAVGNKYFGTDGFRGEANITLTADHAYKVGRFLGWYFSKNTNGKNGYRKANERPRVVIGKDTRRSSYMLEYAIAAGITASGADAYMMHVTTTPSISYVTAMDSFDCGIMITASHNPFYDNGIKVLNGYGEKMDDSTTALIERYLDGDLQALGLVSEDLPFAKRENIGCIVDYVAGRNRYIGYLISVAAHSYRRMKIGLDCANGSSWMTAKAVFEALGAETYVIGAAPDGTNVNLDCGSTHIERLSAFVREQHLSVGFAFDGDADRCIAVDENGRVIDGDGIMYVLAKRLKEKDALDGNTVVATIMSNTGLLRALEREGIDCVQTSVGDRFVYEKMEEKGYRLGGEQSGHIILRKYATTGDGILTAIMLAEEMCDRKQPLSALVADLTLFPQVMKNVRVKDKKAAREDEEVCRKYEELQKKLGRDGRVLLRVSGTEPVIRIMAECEDTAQCEAMVNAMYTVFKKRGLCYDA